VCRAGLGLYLGQAELQGHGMLQVIKRFIQFGQVSLRRETVVVLMLFHTMLPGTAGLVDLDYMHIVSYISKYFNYIILIILLDFVQTRWRSLKLK
jgi:hypothetical protein